MHGVDHVHLRVEDLEAAVSFYTDVMGMVTLDQTGNRVELGCGLGNSVDLVVTGGGTGLDHVAIHLSSSAYRDCERGLERADVTSTPVDHDSDEVDRARRVTLPSGLDVEIVTGTPARYAHDVDTAHPDRGGVAPHTIDHVNVATTAVGDDAEFLADALGLAITEVQETAGDDWLLAFVRSDHTHHTIALTRNDQPAANLKHVAWSMAGLEHMKLFADRIAAAGVELEIGISRHRAGNNLFAYFWEPGGNRFEITAEMATVDPDASTLVRGPDDDTLTAWGGVPFPDSLRNAT